jgi:hypothetical protein
MSLERLNNPPDEIIIEGEGASEVIKKGFAASSLRLLNNKENFIRGESIIANYVDDGEKVPVTVISNVREHLIYLSVPQLALDGYFSPLMVQRGTKTKPAFENIHRNSLMRIITFTKEESYASIPESLKDALDYSRFDELIRMTELRHLFFPTMCHYFTEYGGVKEWIGFLGTHKLISIQEKLDMENYEVNGKNISQYYEENPNIFQKLISTPEDPLFPPMILGIFDQSTAEKPKA